MPKFILRHLDGDVVYEGEHPTFLDALDAASDDNIDIESLDFESLDFAGHFLDGIPVVPDIDRRILAEIEAGGTLEMSAFHGIPENRCGTSHCIAGWAVRLGGEAGSALEDRFDPAIAGALIYAASRPGEPTPNFYCENRLAMIGLRARAAASSQSSAS